LHEKNVEFDARESIGRFLQLAVAFVGPNENSRNLKVGLKFSFWKVRISILLGEMPLPVDSLKILKT
jgi:hypothetical protein